MKVKFYVVTYTFKPRIECEDSISDQMVLSRTELISFLRKGCKFDSIRPFERPDFDNPLFFVQEDSNEQN